MQRVPRGWNRPLIDQGLFARLLIGGGGGLLLTLVATALMMLLGDVKNDVYWTEVGFESISRTARTLLFGAPVLGAWCAALAPLYRSERGARWAGVLSTVPFVPLFVLGSLRLPAWTTEWLQLWAMVVVVPLIGLVLAVNIRPLILGRPEDIPEYWGE